MKKYTQADLDEAVRKARIKGKREAITQGRKTCEGVMKIETMLFWLEACRRLDYHRNEYGDGEESFARLRKEFHDKAEAARLTERGTKGDGG